jgi:hypothetical protein
MKLITIFTLVLTCHLCFSARRVDFDGGVPPAAKSMMTKTARLNFYSFDRVGHNVDLSEYLREISPGAGLSNFIREYESSEMGTFPKKIVSVYSYRLNEPLEYGYFNSFGNFIIACRYSSCKISNSSESAQFGEGGEHKKAVAMLIEFLKSQIDTKVGKFPEEFGDIDGIDKGTYITVIRTYGRGRMGAATLGCVDLLDSIRCKVNKYYNYELR